MAYNVEVDFVWDSGKNKSNIKKHGLSFDEAVKLFEIPGNLILEMYDFEHSISEDRYISIGPISRGVILVVSTEINEDDVVRIISARFATTSEQLAYERNIKGV